MSDRREQLFPGDPGYDRSGGRDPHPASYFFPTMPDPRDDPEAWARQLRCHPSEVQNRIPDPEPEDYERLRHQRDMTRFDPGYRGRADPVRGTISFEEWKRRDQMRNADVEDHRQGMGGGDRQQNTFPNNPYRHPYQHPWSQHGQRNPFGRYPYNHGYGGHNNANFGQGYYSMGGHFNRRQTDPYSRMGHRGNGNDYHDYESDSEEYN